jgi:rhodanese-related sulfurtransferase
VTTQSLETETLLAHAGNVTAAEAWRQLLADPQSVLVDVRTPQEWESAGEADINAAGKTPVKLSWKLAPDWQLNPEFVSEWKHLSISADATLFFLCRSGGRSLDAACEITRQGWKHCYNILDGFEGWKTSQLPLAARKENA